MNYVVVVCRVKSLLKCTGICGCIMTKRGQGCECFCKTLYEWDRVTVRTKSADFTGVFLLKNENMIIWEMLWTDGVNFLQ